MLAFLRFDDTNVPDFPLAHFNVTNGKLEVQKYPKAGDTNPGVKLGVGQVSDGTITWIDIKDNADHYVAWPFWSPDSKYLYFQWMNRNQDTIRIYKSNPYSGIKSKVYEEYQESWVEFFEDLFILKNNAGFLVRSDVDGWRHLYLFNENGKLLQRLTRGDWDVMEIVLVDEKNNVVYFHGAKENTTETHLYKINLNGEGFKRLTEKNGTHSVKVSAGGNFFLDTFSSITEPTRIDLYNNKGVSIRSIGNSESVNRRDYNLGKVDIFKIPTSDGFELPALWVLPPDFDEQKSYPVIFKVYGGPGRSDVKNKFVSFSDFYLAQQGIIVLHIDHRGSGHFGKNGQSKMHRVLGKWELHDWIAAVKWLRQQPYIDHKRIGIGGTSYGGYAACIALTAGAEFFTHGYAGYSVTDWRYYDSVYTERYMDKPDENPEGYRQGSALTFVDKYKGHLLITHGALDDNVHMQNTMAFIQKLEKMNKQFELIIYPNQRHGVRGAWRTHARRSVVDFWFRHFLDRELDVEND
jgi:dipeptidyl-peptidase-4